MPETSGGPCGQASAKSPSALLPPGGSPSRRRVATSVKVRKSAADIDESADGARGSQNSRRSFASEISQVDSIRSCDDMSPAAGGSVVEAMLLKYGARSTRVEELENLHPVVRAAREGDFRSSLLVGDLTKQPKLAEHFQRYTLSNFFNPHGQPSYKNLSMSFAAKQNPDIARSFGSVTSQQGGEGKKKHLSARAYRLATEMIQRDRDCLHTRNQEKFASLQETEKMHLAEVQTRQHEMLFLEVPNYEEFLPAGTKLLDLLPLDIPREREREERKRFEKQNTFLIDPKNVHQKGSIKQHWLLRQEEAIELVQAAATWTAAAGLSFGAGIERAVFCRLVIDLGLIDQDVVPFFWAVTVFDHYARPMRLLSGDTDWADPAQAEKLPLVGLVSKLDLVLVLDTLIRRRWPGGRSPNHREFMAKQKSIVQHKTQQLQKDEKESHALAESLKSSMLADAANALKLDRSNQEGPYSEEAQSRWRRGTAMLSARMSSVPKEAKSGLPKPPGTIQQSTTWDLHRKRGRHLSGALVEPEVLRLVEMHRAVFQTIFECYAEDTGGVMAFPQFIQFCQDFRIVPRIASTHEALRAFHAAESRDPPNVADETVSTPSELLPVLTGAKSTTPFEDLHGRRATLRSSPIEERKESKEGGGQGPPTSIRSSTGGHDGGLAEGSAQRAQKKGRDFSPSKSPRKIEKAAAHGIPPGHAQHRASATASNVRDSPCKMGANPRFGLAAFVEVLCRVAFTYLVSYGNTVQIAMSSRAKMVWLIAYLRGVLAHLKESHCRRTETPGATLGDSPSEQHLVETLDLQRQATPTERHSPTPPVGSPNRYSRRRMESKDKVKNTTREDFGDSSSAHQKPVTPPLNAAVKSQPCLLSAVLNQQAHQRSMSKESRSSSQDQMHDEQPQAVNRELTLPPDIAHKMARTSGMEVTSAPAGTVGKRGTETQSAPLGSSLTRSHVVRSSSNMSFMSDASGKASTSRSAAFRKDKLKEGDAADKVEEVPAEPAKCVSIWLEKVLVRLNLATFESLPEVRLQLEAYESGDLARSATAPAHHQHDRRSIISERAPSPLAPLGHEGQSQSPRASPINSPSGWSRTRKNSIHQDPGDDPKRASASNPADKSAKKQQRAGKLHMARSNSLAAHLVESNSAPADTDIPEVKDDAILFSDMLFWRLLDPSMSTPDRREDGRKHLVSDRADLNGTFGIVERDRLTPPPMNKFATEFNDRLDKMLNKDNLLNKDNQ